MTRFLPKPSSDQSFSRAIDAWRAEANGEAPHPRAGERAIDDLATPRSIWSYAPYAVAVALALGAGAAAASLATAPALTDSIETVAAIDARDAGFATNLDPAGQQKKAATLSRDVVAMKSEITRLQRALDQAKSSQTAASKSAAGQAAQASDEVKTLKAELAGLQKTLENTRGDAAARIESLNAKLDQSKGDATELAALRSRVEKFEQFAKTDKTPADRTVASKRAEPETTGSITRDEPRREDHADRGQQPAEQQVASNEDQPKIIRNWTVREVQRGVALLEGRYGMIEVVRGAKAPGMGRVRSIERRDGQWVVVTDKGTVLERNEL